LADEAVKVLKAKSRTDGEHIDLREIVALKRFKTLMKKNSGKFPDSMSDFVIFDTSVLVISMLFFTGVSANFRALRFLCVYVTLS
jgi:hypothetical protein